MKSKRILETMHGIQKKKPFIKVVALFYGEDANADGRTDERRQIHQALVRAVTPAKRNRND